MILEVHTFYPTNDCCVVRIQKIVLAICLDGEVRYDEGVCWLLLRTTIEFCVWFVT